MLSQALVCSWGGGDVTSNASWHKSHGRVLPGKGQVEYPKERSGRVPHPWILDLGTLLFDTWW